MRTKLTPSGYILQLYRQASGFSLDKLKTNLSRYKAAGVTGIAPHGFMGDMDVHKFDEYVQIAKSQDLLCYAAFGLGPTHAYDRGVWMGKVAQHPACAGVLFDIEGAFEISSGKAAAVDIGKGFVSQFKDGVVDVWTCDQPWADPAYHWSEFPWEEIAAYVDARAAQFYFNDWKGSNRYKTLDPKFHHDWATLDARLVHTNSVRPLMMTLQAYAWADIFPDYIACLLENPTAFMWCDLGLPTENALLGMFVVTQLEKLGFRGEKAVEAFQLQWNKDHPDKKISVDNRMGYGETLPALLGRSPTVEEKSNP